MEKAVHAFTLLGYLVQMEESFVFKGGTSLLLHVPRMKRLSIDIDIVYDGDVDSLIAHLSEALPDSPFIRSEEHMRGALRKRYNSNNRRACR